MCDKGKGWKTHVPFHTYLPLTAKRRARLKEEEAGGRQRWKPLKFRVFDEDANTLIAFQTFRVGRRKPWRPTDKELCVKKRGAGGRDGGDGGILDRKTAQAHVRESTRARETNGCISCKRDATTVLCVPARD